MRTARLGTPVTEASIDLPSNRRMHCLGCICGDPVNKAKFNRVFAKPSDKSNVVSRKDVSFAMVKDVDYLPMVTPVSSVNHSGIHLDLVDFLKIGRFKAVLI